ncbi:hypothetical protein [Bradyrhizobium iriomotense]|uniref:Ribbon-helix-helix protein CopG domain-containing protein n=1 Tax=Bradyrhizobium iriomotense TaxID=441950 RepID=A0ABQ6B983_9BRAD|nr:hypothetical protein [Bradyrhizobium iriomotense]GLR90348.1 hypothetical protein GCM10007857_70630 [Bradyrhizobium iriomotense]
MAFNTAIDEASGPKLEKHDTAERTGQQNTAATRKITVQLSEKIVRRLDVATDRPGLGKSMVVEAALERFLDPAPPIEGLIHEALDRINRQLERLDSDVRTIAETVALHARYHLTVTPQMPQSQQPEACALGQERFKALAEQVDRRVRSNRPLLRETIDQINASRDSGHAVEDDSQVSAESTQEGPAAIILDATADTSAAAEEGGSNRNFQILPNAFC